MTYIYTLTFLAFGVCVAAVAVVAGVEKYNKRRIRRMSFVQLHRVRMRGLG
jgi:hypothetical protein